MRRARLSLCRHPARRQQQRRGLHHLEQPLSDRDASRAAQEFPPSRQLPRHRGIHPHHLLGTWLDCKQTHPPLMKALLTHSTCQLPRSQTFLSQSQSPRLSPPPPDSPQPAPGLQLIRPSNPRASEPTALLAPPACGARDIQKLLPNISISISISRMMSGLQRRRHSAHHPPQPHLSTYLPSPPRHSPPPSSPLPRKPLASCTGEIQQPKTRLKISIPTILTWFLPQGACGLPLCASKPSQHQDESIDGPKCRGIHQTSNILAPEGRNSTDLTHARKGSQLTLILETL
jgi:hypothetical protein